MRACGEHAASDVTGNQTGGSAGQSGVAARHVNVSTSLSGSMKPRQNARNFQAFPMFLRPEPSPDEPHVADMPMPPRPAPFPPVSTASGNAMQQFSAPRRKPADARRTWVTRPDSAGLSWPRRRRGLRKAGRLSECGPGQPAGSTNSTSTPPASLGCTKLIREPAVPRRGESYSSRSPRSCSAAQAASTFATV